MDSSKFEQALNEKLKKYFPEEKKATGCKTEEILQREMSLFGDPDNKETFAQKAVRFGAKAITKPASISQKISQFARDQEQGGTLSALARTDWARKRSQNPGQESTTGLFSQTQQGPSPTSDPAGFQAHIKQQWRQLPIEVQRAYGTEAAYLNIKTQEATHAK